MPPKVKVTREQILKSAVDIVRREGFSGLNVRALASRMGVSTQPIFSNFESIEELKGAVVNYAAELYGTQTKELMESGKYPPYKASGMAYIAFAQKEKELFKLLFMCDRTNCAKGGFDDIDHIIEIIQKSLGTDRERAEFFHLEMWAFVHGIATMYATSYLELDANMVSRMLTDMYEGLKHRFSEEG